MDNLTPIAHTTLGAMTELGQGTAQQVRDKTGRSKTATDKAIGDLAKAGLIVAVDPDPDAPANAPTTWQPANTTAADTDEPDIPVIDEAEPPPDDDPSDASDAPRSQAGHVDTLVDDPESDDPPTDEDMGVTGDDAADTPDDVAAPQPRRIDRKVLVVAGVLGDYPDGVTIDVIADACGLTTATVARLLAAMQTADAARRLPADPDGDNTDRWVAGEGRATSVDVTPPPPQRCPTCGRLNRPGINREPGSAYAGGPLANSDGNDRLIRNELRGLVLEFINARAGDQFTPQAIAVELGDRQGRAISSGAVRNNCTTLAAAGLIQLAVDAPLQFTANPTGTTN